MKVHGGVLVSIVALVSVLQIGCTHDMDKFIMKMTYDPYDTTPWAYSEDCELGWYKVEEGCNDQ